MTFVLSIETDIGTYVHGYHLGTMEDLARKIAEEAFQRWTPRKGNYIRTVALMQGGRVFDVFDGVWFNLDIGA